MLRNCYNTESCCYNNNSCNSCDSYGNGVSGFGCSWFYILAILLLFSGGGFGQGSFWSDYDKIFRCSGFNNGWCNNMGSNNFNNSIFSNDNFSSNNLSNTNIAGLLGSTSSNSNFDIGNFTNTSN